MNCICCENEIIAYIYDSYYQCNSCKSYNYISLKSADEDNREYFDKIYNKERKFPSILEYFFICKKSLNINSQILNSCFIFKKEE